MYKLVAIDLDGTMLNSYGVVTDNTKEKIKQTIEKNIDVIIASGRPIGSIKSIAKDIGSEKYFIAGNGAIVYDIKNDEIIYNKHMSKNKVLEIIKICEENSISYNVYTDKHIIATALKYNVLYYHKENLKKEESKKTIINIVDNMYKYVEGLKEENFLKITVCDEHKMVFNSIIKKLREIKNIDVMDVSHMSRKIIKQGTEDISIEYYYTEISSENVDKWYALEFLMNKLNLNKEEVMAIGDNINDKKMIEEAGLGVVMKGSNPEVLNISKCITDTNNEEGVAKILEKFCL